MAQITSPVTAHHVRLLIDPGSELTFVSEQLVQALNIQRHHSSTPILGIGGLPAIKTRGVATLHLQSLHSSESVVVRAYVLNSLTSSLPSFQTAHPEWPHLRHLTLADPEFFTPRPVDVIIGADYYGQIIRPGLVKGPPNSPIGQFTIFGWTILGPVSTNRTQPRPVLHATPQVPQQSLHDMLARFWVQEEVPSDTSRQLTPDEQACENHFVSTHSRLPSGQYVVRLPLKQPATLLGDSFKTAHHCLVRLLRRFKRDSTYHQLYTQFMQEYEHHSHMVQAPETTVSDTLQPASGDRDTRMTLAHDAPASGGLRVLGARSLDLAPSHSPFYLPHHGVLRPDSSTTKLRVVFNGSSPSVTGKSLNDIMHTGAKLQPDISDVLLWIRHHRVVFSTDITKMYRQILVHRDDWDLQRILWIDDQLNIVPYQLTTVTYGTRSAPFLAMRTLLQLVKDEGHRFPLAVPALTKGRYVDDIFGGADSVDEALKVAQQLTGAVA